MSGAGWTITSYDFRYLVNPCVLPDAFILDNYPSGFGYSDKRRGKKEDGGKAVLWYDDSAFRQLNQSKSTYYWIAIE